MAPIASAVGASKVKNDRPPADASAHGGMAEKDRSTELDKRLQS